MRKFPFEIQDSSQLAAVIMNNGRVPGVQTHESGESRLKIEDAVSSKEIAPLLKDALVEILIEAGNPTLILTGLLDRVDWEGAGQQVYNMPAIGTFSVERVGEGEEYPEKSLQIGGATVTATIDKWGVKLAFTDEAIRYSRWDLIALHMREAGKAFSARKEYEVARHITGMAITVFDNLDPTMSIRGVTTGRGADGAANGTWTVDDIFDMYAQILMTGYTPNLLIMHPLTWIQFVKDPELRTFALAAANQTFFGGWTGNAVNHSGVPAPKKTIAGGHPFAGLGTPVDTTRANPTLADFEPSLQSAPQLPGGLPFTLRILVTPYMPMDPTSRLTDIIMCDASVLGALVVEEDLMNVGWSDIAVDIQYMKFRERYGIIIYEEGNGIAVAKNVLVDQNHFSVMKGVPTVDYFISDGDGGTALSLPIIPPNVPVV